MKLLRLCSQPDGAFQPGKESESILSGHLHHRLQRHSFDFTDVLSRDADVTRLISNLQKNRENLRDERFKKNKSINPRGGGVLPAFLGPKQANRFLGRCSLMAAVLPVSASCWKIQIGTLSIINTPSDKVSQYESSKQVCAI